MKRESLSIIIPVYNEEASLVELHNAIHDCLASNNVSFECIYIDDGSTDRSHDVLQGMKKKFPHIVRIIHFPKNRGKSVALSAGFSQAKNNILVTIDADLQDDPRGIIPLLSKYYEGYDLVCGWRKKRHDTWQKRALSKIYNVVLSTASGVQLHDFNTGLKLFSGDIVDTIDLRGHFHRYLPVLAASHGFHVTEVEVKHHKRKYGKSKYGPTRIALAAVDFIATLFSLSLTHVVNHHQPTGKFRWAE